MRVQLALGLAADTFFLTCRCRLRGQAKRERKTREGLIMALYFEYQGDQAVPAAQSCDCCLIDCFLSHARGGTHPYIRERPPDTRVSTTQVQPIPIPGTEQE